MAVSELPMLGADERELVTRTWNATQRPFSDGARVHELIAAQAARTPEALAVVGLGRAADLCRARGTLQPPRPPPRRARGAP